MFIIQVYLNPQLKRRIWFFECELALLVTLRGENIWKGSFRRQLEDSSLRLLYGPSAGVERDAQSREPMDQALGFTSLGVPWPGVPRLGLPRQRIPRLGYDDLDQKT